MCTLLFVAASAGLAHSQTRPLRFGTGVEMVKLSVSVTDPHNSYVAGLEQGDFAVFEDGVPQELSLFARKDLPLSLVFMIDASSSMEAKRASAQEAALRLARILRPEDVAEVVAFNERVAVLQPFTSDPAAIEAAIRRTDANGMTALHTSLYITLKEQQQQQQARSGELRRRAIVLFTDGEDTASSVTDDQVLELAQKSDVTIYTILLQARPDRPGEALIKAEYLMSALGRETGGRAYFPAALRELDSVYDRIGQELRTLYGVGYAPSNAQRDGKWRRIVVRVRTREGLTVHHRVGYFAPAGDTVARR